MNYTAWLIVLFCNLITLLLILLLLFFMLNHKNKRNYKNRDYKNMVGTIKNGLDFDFVSSLASIYNVVRNEDEKKLALREAADKLLNRLAITDYPIPVEDIIRAMGFSLYENVMPIPSVSGYIAIDPKLRAKFNNDKIIVVNSNDSVGHQRFAIAHEIAHYIYDYDGEKSLYDLYDTNRNNIDNPREKRANRFAAELMIPAAPFLSIIKEIELENLSLVEGIVKAAKLFDVSTTSIIKRFGEVGKANLLEGSPYEIKTS